MAGTCEIRINETGQRIGVYDKNGNPSKLFNQILNNAHILNFDDALGSYLNISEQDNGELALQYSTQNGQVFDNFGDALKSVNQGEIVAFVNSTELFRISTDLNPKSVNGLINSFIKENILEDTTVIDTDGKKLYRPKGNSELKRYITSDFAISSAKGYFGNAVKRNEAGDIWFDTNLIGKREAVSKAGETIYLTEQEYTDRSFRSFEDPVGVLAERAYNENNRAFGNTKPTEEIEIIPENLLQEKLLSLLQQLGIKTVSLESYNKKYSPDVRALADIADKLIAFRDGKINQEDLTEEVSHFIVEATDETEIENLLRNIHKTEEWAQYEQTYREIYSAEYPAAQVEEMVRKEILGKVLSNSLQNNFNRNRNSTTENTIIGRLQDIFNRFFERINNFFKPSYKQELDRYLDSIYANLMTDTLYDELSPEQFNGKKYILYSSEKVNNSAEYKKLVNVLNHLSNQQYQLANKRKSPASQNMLKEARQELEKSQQALDKEVERVYRLKALTKLAIVANSQLDYLSRVIDENAKKGQIFAQEENSVYQNFMTRLRPLMSQIKGQLNKKDRSEKSILDDLDKALNKSLELEAKIPENNEAVVKNLVERVIEKSNMTEAEANKYREQLTNVLTTAQKDTNWFHAHLGHLVHAENMLLNLAGHVIAKTHTRKRALFLPRIKEFLNQVNEVGFDPRQLKNLIGKDGRILNEKDNNKLEILDKSIQTRIYNEITGKNIKDDEFNPDLVNELNVDDRTLFENQWREIERNRRESFFTKEHLDKLENFSIEVAGKTLKRKDLPKVALDYEGQYRGQLTEIRVNNAGINTEGDKAEIEELNKQRVNNSNPRNADGSLKKGLQEVYDEQRGQYVIQLEDADILANLDEEALNEANRVYGLQMINLLNKEFYQGSAKNENIPQSFIDKLNEFETEQEKWDFVRLNAYVGFKPEFWENFGQTQTLTGRLLEQKDGTNDAEIDDLLADIRGQQQVISNILRANRTFNRPSETNVTQMGEVAMQEVRDATIQLESLYSKANTLLPREEQIEVERLFESQVNEAFRKDLEDEEINSDEERIAFILKHVTPNNRQAIENAVKVTSKIKEGDAEVVIKRSLQNIFSEDMPAEEAQTALMRYAESKLLPYYKRTEPIGFSEEYDSFLEDVNNNVEGAVENYIQSSEFTEISPSYSFYSQNEAINPKWVANRDAKKDQYTEEFLQQIRNDEFYERYGIDENGNPTKNLTEWKAREALLELQDWSLENYEVSGVHDRYLLPQQHKTNFRRLNSFIGNPDSKAIGQSLLDIVNYREDETDTGQDEQGNIVTNSNQILSIPKYGLSRLKEQSDVTDELLYSYAWMAQQSALYRARKENISDMFALNQALLKQEFTDKSSEATNAYKMFKSYLNYNYYGVKESFSHAINIFGKKVDLGKLARVFNNYVRFLNLTGVIVPLTSLAQSQIQKKVESRIEETTNRIANKLANKEFLKYASGAAAEVMDLNSKNRINVLGEAYGQYDPTTSRYENSNYGKGTRTTLQFASGLHSLGNFPVVSRVMLSVVLDYRYFNGRVITYNQYKRLNPQTEKNQLDRDWQKLDLLYDDIITKDGVQSYNKENISKKLGLEGEALDERITLLHESISDRIEAAVQDIDSQVAEKDRSIAARDARAAFLLLHSNWLVLALTKRFKGKSYDISRETYTEGSWVSTFDFFKDMAVSRKSLKKAWQEADETTRRNLTRTVLDLAVANSLAVAALLLANYVDDDDDPMWGLAFADYMFTRVANEQVSSTIAFPGQLANTLENPVIAADRFFGLADIGNLLSDEQVTRGTYSGYTERYKFLSQSVPIVKDYFRLTNPKKVADTYQYYNKSTQDWALLSYFFDDGNEE